MDTNIVTAPKVSHLSRSIRTVGISAVLMAIFGLLDLYKIYFFVFEGQAFTAIILFGVPTVLLLNWKYGFKIWGIQLLVFFISIPLIVLLFLVPLYVLAVLGVVGGLRFF